MSGWGEETLGLAPGKIELLEVRLRQLRRLSFQMVGQQGTSCLVTDMWEAV